jgi:hypothetical protein
LRDLPAKIAQSSSANLVPSLARAEALVTAPRKAIAAKRKRLDAAQAAAEKAKGGQP